MARPLPRLTPAEIERVIATAWDDRPPFNAVLMQHGLAPGQVVQLLKKELTPNAFKVWTARTRGAVLPASPPARPAPARRAAARPPSKPSRPTSKPSRPPSKPPPKLPPKPPR